MPPEYLRSECSDFYWRLTQEERRVEAVIQEDAYMRRTGHRLPAGPVEARKKAADREPKRRVLVPARAKGPRTGRGGFA